MTLYLDTSLLVTALTMESATGHVQAWLQNQAIEELSISDCVVTEFSSALSNKMRTGQLTADKRKVVTDLFAQTIVDVLTVLPVQREHFRTAARYAEHHGLGLRGADALHLAVAADQGATICTRDRKLADASVVLGVPVEFL